MCAICDLNIHFDVEPASALPVALATRRAIEGGRLPAPEFSADPVGDRNPRRLAVRALAGVQQRLEQVHAPEALVALPDFFVLIIESRSWGFFHPTPGGFDPNWTPDAPRIEGARPSATQSSSYRSPPPTRPTRVGCRWTRLCARA